MNRIKMFFIMFFKCSYTVYSFQGYIQDLFRFVTFYVYYTFVIIQLLLTFKADTPSTGKRSGKVTFPLLFLYYFLFALSELIL